MEAKKDSKAPVIEEDSWDDFPVACPKCFGIMQPPLLDSAITIFPCIYCGIYLEKPTYLQRSLFYMDTSLHSAARSWQRLWGRKFYTYLPVTVPEGSKAGDTVQAMYKGMPYHAKVPDGLKAGDLFNVQIDVTNDPPKKAFKAKRSQIGEGYKFQMPKPVPAQGVLREPTPDTQIKNIELEEVPAKKEDKQESSGPTNESSDGPDIVPLPQATPAPAKEE